MNENERLASLTRKELVDGALELGIPRPELLTRAELVLEITRVAEGGKVRRPAGFFDVARALLASVVEQGLNLPDAAKFIRGGPPPPTPPAPAPIATVTLAQIYGAQGHLDKALSTVDEILRAEPDHEAAQRLAAKLRAQIDEQKVPGKAARPAPARKRAAIGGARADGRVEAEENATQPVDVTEAQALSVPVEAVPVEAVPVEAVPVEAVPVEAAPPDPLAAPPVPTPVVVEVPAVNAEPVRPKSAADFVTVAWSVDTNGRRKACRLLWDLSAESRRAAAARWGAGSPAMKILSVTPGPSGATQREWIALSAPSGTLGLDDVSAVAEVRAALGWATSDSFHVLGTAPVVELGSGGVKTVWKPRSGANEVALHAWIAART